MHSASYEITALIARYILIFLSLSVLIRTIFISRASRPNAMIPDKENSPRLVAVGTGKTYYMGFDNIIGASKRCDIQVSGRGVGKIHIQIYKKKDGWMLCTYSRKPTMLNEIKVNGSMRISPNDVVKLGSQKYRFELPESMEL